MSNQEGSTEVVTGSQTALRESAILSPEALAFVAHLTRRFRGRVKELLLARAARQQKIVQGDASFGFLTETESVRRGDWTVSPPPAEVEDRRVEITGPVDRKMIINALNSGASVFMADFEDSTCPTLSNLVQGQENLRDANLRTITFEQGDKRYKLVEKPAVLFVRPRGWHLEERHFLVDGEATPGGLFDFGLYLFHNAKILADRGSQPYFYLPKLESHLEARLWNEVFLEASAVLGIPRGTIRATVLIETLPAAFEMDEILHELREHSLGLNCGRWDYIFSFIKKQSHLASAVLPDRGQVTMDKGFLRAYSELLVRTCHRRGAHAMGGMAAQIPIKNDPAANEAALAKVRADKLREVRAGHDGTWVAHPALVPVAKEIFDREMPGKNQLDKLRQDVTVSAADLLGIPQGTRTDVGLRHNIRVGVQYIEAWLRGVGCVPIYNLMEDAATAEISRAQVWQWLHYGAELEGRGKLDLPGLQKAVAEELLQVRAEVGDARFAEGRFEAAKDIFLALSTAERFTEFLTLPAYETLLREGQ